MKPENGIRTPGAPTICLNMIVRNETAVICELLDSMLPLITTWVIVDTGSTDGTQDMIRDYFAERGIPGVLYERPWRNFGANRTEAMDLAQGHADYIWLMDADDIWVGRPDLTQLTADNYVVLAKSGRNVFWRPHIFRDGLPWRWVGVLHEYSTCDVPFTQAKLEGDCWLQGRSGGARSSDPEKYLRDAELLLAEVHRNPDDCRSVFYLAQSYRDYGDLRSARQWYAKRAEMGGWPEEVYFSLQRVAECTAGLGEPWPMVQDALLRAWAYRPTRAEALCAIASHYRGAREWQLGYLFAELAARIPLPTDTLFVTPDVYTVTALDEQAICAYWLGKHEESFTLCQRLLARDDLDDSIRQRIVVNRDFAVPAMLEAGREYPEALARRFATAGSGSDITVTLTAGADRIAVEHTLNSFLHFCTDMHRLSRFILFDTGLSDADRDYLADRYPFMEVCPVSAGAEITDLYRSVASRFWLHLDAGWQLFASEPLLSRLTAILDVEPDVYQVGLNLNDAVAPANQSAPQGIVRSSPVTGRYTMTAAPAGGPAMYDTTRYDGLGPVCAGTATLAEIIVSRTAGESVPDPVS